MTKYAFIDGNFRTDATEDGKSCFVDGELQKRIEGFVKTHKVINVQPYADRMVMIAYEV